MTFEEALDLAEREAEEYADTTAKRCGLLHGFWLFDDFKLKKQGIEVFSLLRESDLAPKAYLKSFFDTGYEMQGEHKARPRGSPNRRTRAKKNRKRVPR